MGRWLSLSSEDLVKFTVFLRSIPEPAYDSNFLRFLVFSFLYGSKSANSVSHDKIQHYVSSLNLWGKYLIKSRNSINQIDCTW